MRGAVAGGGWRMVTTAVVLALTAGISMGCTATDERAYSIDTGSMALDEGLELYGLTMPDCPVRDLRYALVGTWGGHDLYLRFSATADCMTSFLDINDMTGIGETTSAQPFPHGNPKLGDVGWTFPDGVVRQRYHPKEPPGRDLVAVVDASVDPQVVSMYGFPF